MIINNFNIERVIFNPLKTNPMPVVDPDAMLSSAIPFELFKVVGWRRMQIDQGISTMKHTQLPKSHTLHGLVEPV